MGGALGLPAATAIGKPVRHAAAASTGEQTQLAMLNQDTCRQMVFCPASSEVKVWRRAEA
jgi:hypothetical protein